MRDDKALLRSRLSAARATRSVAEREAAGAALARHALAAFAQVSAVAAYASMGTEPPTRPLLDGLRATGVRVLLPVVDGPRLDWSPYDGWDALVSGPRGCPEPAGERLGAGALDSVDVVLVPALGVDRAGHRLGRGAGYYDRALVAVEARRAVAVVYDDEVLDALPVQPHDRPVGAALTPAGLRRLGVAGGQ